MRESAFHASIFAVSKTRNWGVILRWLLVFFDSARRCLGVERLRANVQEKAFKAKGMRCGLAGKRETPTACDRVFSPNGSAYSH